MIAALVWASGVGAHRPATAIGRAVEAFQSVTVSYESGAAVSEVEAGGFPLVVGDDPKVAFIPASAADELAGGSSVIAEEIAREARLDGTLVVLVGTALGAWSSEISGDRLAVLVQDAQARGGSPAAKTEALVRAVQAEPESGTRWALLVALLVPALGALAVVARRARAR